MMEPPPPYTAQPGVHPAPPPGFVAAYPPQGYPTPGKIFTMFSFSTLHHHQQQQSAQNATHIFSLKMPVFFYRQITAAPN